MIVRFLGHLGLPTDIPEARAPPLHLGSDAPPTEVAGDQILFDEPRSAERADNETSRTGELIVAILSSRISMRGDADLLKDLRRKYCLWRRKPRLAEQDP